MSGAKQQYDELIALRAWDKETQIRFFLEYAEEYQLSAHFLSFLAQKPVATVKTLTRSDNYSTEQLIEILSKNEAITRIIREQAMTTPISNPWTERIMLACIAEWMSISVEPDNALQLRELLTYFNEKHAYFLRAMNKTTIGANDEVSDKYRFGARG